MSTIRWMRVLQIVLDTILTIASLSCAYMIRFDFHVDGLYLSQLCQILPLFVGLRLTANLCAGVYRRLWRYTGLTEVTELGCAVLG
ncbi:MAG: hypothetical protein JSS86_22935, partial [Cyanobacteria bacterium SZAS LIN-2]|nr:hypothetical protein [Cyanobacteria bacterium SZAS LIN-2]